MSVLIRNIKDGAGRNGWRCDGRPNIGRRKTDIQTAVSARVKIPLGNRELHSTQSVWPTEASTKVLASFCPDRTSAIGGWMPTFIVSEPQVASDAGTER